jgi:hypothetical protein
MATRATRKPIRKKKPAKKTPNKPAAKKPAAKKLTAKKRLPFLAVDDMATLKEELGEARAELARIASGDNSARRNLEAQSSLGRTVEERLRAELEAMRTDLRTALADLEIARADQLRAEAKLIDGIRELQAARENERLATHASADARDRLLDLERENQRMKDQLAAREELSTERKENGSP